MTNRPMNSATTWQKLGLVFAPTGRFPWMQSHASNPTAESRPDGLVRVYFGSRDVQRRTHIGWVDLDLSRSPRVVRMAEDPVVAPGPVGAFDDSGTSVGCLVHDDGRTLLYYMGWNLGVTVPWRNSIGLAIRNGSDGPFVKYSCAPIVDRSDCDPFTLSYPFVLREPSGWRMWYGSNLQWSADKHDMNHVIKYAESDDGVHWRRTGRIAIDIAPPEEYAACRPSVVRDGDRYHMWYCHRGEAYRLAHADSADGLTWTQRADPGIDVSSTGWDSEMIAYPCVFAHEGRTYLLYNGNDYGRAGFGLAVLEGSLST